MESKEVLVITNYISVWGWMIISMLCLAFTFLFLALPRTNVTLIFMVVFFLLFGITQFVSTKRRKEFETQNGKEE